METRREAERKKIAREIAEEREKAAQIEQVKKNIAEALRREYKRVVEDGMQVLGDLRDVDVKEGERVDREAAQAIEAGERKRAAIERQLDQEEPAGKKLEKDVEKRGDGGSKEVRAALVDDDVKMVDHEEIQLALDDKVAAQQRLDNERESAEIAYYIRRVFIRRLLKQVDEGIDENRRLEH